MGIFDNFLRTDIVDSQVDSSLVNLKKEQKTVQYSSQDVFSPDYSTVETITDARQFSLTNAPTLVFNSAGATVGGAEIGVTQEASLSPQVTSKKEQVVEQSSGQSAEQSQKTEGLLPILIIGGVAVGGYFFVRGGKK